MELSTPALLFPAVAILMLGYINRYVSMANVIRNLKKDYDSGYVHAHVIRQIKILQRRIILSKYMLTIGVVSLIFAGLSMLFIFLNIQQLGKIVFGLSLIALITSMLLSLYETSLSNLSLEIEVNDIIEKEEEKLG